MNQKTKKQSQYFTQQFFDSTFYPFRLKCFCFVGSSMLNRIERAKRISPMNESGRENHSH